MASRIARTASLPALLLLSTAAAWAGRGDIDSNYGEGGRLTARTVYYSPTFARLVAVNLPDDSLMTLEESVLLRRFDAEGRLDLTFGDDGLTTIPPFPDATPFFEVHFNPVPTPDGGFLIAGLMRNDVGDTFFEVLIRLDRDGRLLTSFGGNGDGIYRLTSEPIPQVCGGICTALVGIAVDSSGRVLLAKRGWDAQGQCGVARLTPDGAIDTAFGTNGEVDITGVDLCAGPVVFGTRSDDSILVGGSKVVIRLDSTGARDTTFGTAGELSATSSDVWTSGLSLPDGSLLLAGSNSPAQSPPAMVLAKFDPSGQPDLSFADGNGRLRYDVSRSLTGSSGLLPHVSAMASTADGGQLALQVSLMRADGDAVCAGAIARLSGEGTIDESFGSRGFTCLDYGAFPFTLVGLQRDGAPLFGRVDGNFYRLLLDATASSGFLTLARSGVRQEVRESDGSATLSVVRAAGQDGAVSAHFYTREAPRDPRCYSPCSTAHIARADSDYRSASGRLEWADGEAGSRSTTVDILDDSDQEQREVFLVYVDDPQGGTQLYGDDYIVVGINDDATVTPPPPPPPPPQVLASSGGGGSTSGLAIAALAALVMVASRRRRAASRSSRIALLPGLLLLVNAAAWAGRGDIDPNYGVGGRVSAANAVLLALPGDRLVIGQATDEGFRVRMVDAAGQNVPTFGEGGVALINSSAFWPESAALAPNGDIIFMGSGYDSVRTLLRLDQDGQPVTSFGSSGDGFVEPAALATVLAIDPDGNIVFAGGSWNPDGSCSPAQLQRLLDNGQPDAEFGGDGLIEIPDLDLCHGVPVLGSRADGSVIVGDHYTLVAVDSAGNIDPAFGVDGRLVVTELASVRGVLLPDGGLLLFGSNDESASANDTVLLKFDRNGQPDLDFGAGAGSVTVDLGATLLGMPASREYVGQLMLDPDGEHVIAQLSVSHADGSPACGDGIARLSLDGVPDASFGRNGLTCLNTGSDLVAVQGNGAPLFLAGYSSDSILRLLPDNSPSPGLLTAMATRFDVDESAGTVSMVIERAAGRDGAASVIFATFDLGGTQQCGPPPHGVCGTNKATAGGDYTATSGRLDWASGDDGQRTVTIRIADDGIVESLETFGFVFSEPGGGVLLVARHSILYIHDNDTASSSPPPPPDDGGGGSISWSTALALLTLLLMRRRRNRDGTPRRSSCCA